MTDQSMRDFTAALFGRASTSANETGNHVPREGNNPPPRPAEDEDDLRLFVQTLFADNA